MMVIINLIPGWEPGTWPSHTVATPRGQRRRRWRKVVLSLYLQRFYLIHQGGQAKNNDIKKEVKGSPSLVRGSSRRWTGWGWWSTSHMSPGSPSTTSSSLSTYPDYTISNQNQHNLFLTLYPCPGSPWTTRSGWPLPQSSSLTLGLVGWTTMSGTCLMIFFSRSSSFSFSFIWVDRTPGERERRGGDGELLLLLRHQRLWQEERYHHGCGATINTVSQSLWTKDNQTWWS